MLTIAADVGAPTLCQLCPPSAVRATTPSGPPAYATAPDAGASVTKEPAILLPIGRQVAPASSEISTLPATERKKLEQLADETRQRHERLRATVSSLQESLDYLRLSIKYLVFDLEATRRENGYLRKMLEETSGND